jgi:Acyl-CoA reductase (LuxC)
MNLDQRIAAFLSLGELIGNISEEQFRPLARQAAFQNAWFTPDNIRHALQGIVKMLQPDSMLEWISRYQIPSPDKPKKIGVIMAGNIPFVGFHDALCVLLSGHILMARPSSSDTVIPTWVLGQLVKLEPAFQDFIIFVERVNQAEAIIATGSDNSARYFEYYFGNKPHIIRHNRNSVAILTGEENQQHFSGLAEDIFRYFGLGCRNVSKLYVPPQYDFIPLLDTLIQWPALNEHSKYFNNYEYNRAVYLINQLPHLDTGTLTVINNKAIASPVGVLHFEEFSNIGQLRNELNENRDRIQVIVSSDCAIMPAVVPLGHAQQPELWDYADNVDTLQFLLRLNQAS